MEITTDLGRILSPGRICRGSGQSLSEGDFGTLGDATLYIQRFPTHQKSSYRRGNVKSLRLGPDFYAVYNAVGSECCNCFMLLSALNCLWQPFHAGIRGGGFSQGGGSTGVRPRGPAGRDDAHRERQRRQVGAASGYIESSPSTIVCLFWVSLVSSAIHPFTATTVERIRH